MRITGCKLSGAAAAVLALVALSGCDPEESKLGKLVDSAPDSCEIPDQKTWVFETMQEAYLWNDELPTADTFVMSDYETPEEVLSALRVEIDRWSRINDKTTSDALFMEGLTLAFGIGTTVTTGSDGEDRVQVRYTDIDSPAALAGIRRGDVILTVDGDPALEADWGPREEGVVRTIEYIPREQVDAPEPEVISVEVTKSWYKIITVPEYRVLEANGQRVGYVMFTSHLDPSKDELNAAFKEFKAQGVDSVIVDLRYNGGGLVAVSRYLMHLLAAKNHAGKTAYKVVYNDNLSESNTTRELSELENSVDIDKVAFITTGRTASASELVINAMIPHMETWLVGSTTSGKPVGMNRFEFCEKPLWPITFKFVNADGNADYFEGFDVDCPATDDLLFDYGDPQEAMIASALDVLADGQCTQGYAPQQPAPAGELVDPIREIDPLEIPGAVVTDVSIKNTSRPGL